MADTLAPLIVQLRADASGLYTEYGKVTDATKKMTSETTAEAKKTSDALGKMGSSGGSSVGSSFLDNLKKFALPIGGVIAGFGIGTAVKKSVDLFESMAGSVKSLGRITGGTAEQVSSLAGAFKLSGVDVGTATTMIGRLSRSLVSASDGGDKAKLMAEKLGTSFTDASGKIMPMTTLLPEIADRFQAMPDGAEKTALAMQLFGRNGAAMLPFLNKGSAGIAELEANASKMGLTLDQVALNSFSAATIASRNFHSQVTGLQQTLGGSLMPIMDSVQAAFYNGLAPAIQMLTDWLNQNQSVFEELAGVLGGIVTDAMTSLVPIVQELLNVLGPILIDTVRTLLPVIGDLVKMIGPILGNVIKVIIPVIGEFLKTMGPLLGDVLKAAVELIGQVVQQLGPVLGDAIAQLMPVIGLMLQAFGKIFVALQPLIPVLIKLVMAFSPLIDPMLRLATAIIPILVAVLVPLITMLTNLATGVIEGIVIPVINFLVSAISWLVTSFTDGGNQMNDTATGIGQFFSDIFNGIYNNVIKPVFDAIAATFTWIYEVIIKPIILGIGIYVAIWMAIITFLYENVIKPIFEKIAAIFTWIYENVIQPVIKAIGDLFTWLYENIIKPVFDAIAAVFKWIWETIMVPWFDGFMKVIKFLGAVFVWLYENVIKPVFDGIGAAFKWVWENIIQPVVGFMVKAFELVGKTVSNIFGGIGDFIRGVFGNIIDFVKGIINHLIDAGNFVADAINPFLEAGPVHDILHSLGVDVTHINHIPHLAEGGVVMPTPGGKLIVAGDGNEPEAVVPLSKLPSMNGGHNITINAQTNATPTHIASAVGWTLRQMG